MKDILNSLGLEADNPGTWLGPDALSMAASFGFIPRARRTE